MNSRVLGLVGAMILVVGAAGATAWWLRSDQPPPARDAIAAADLPSANLPAADLPAANLPAAGTATGDPPSDHLPSDYLPAGNLPVPPLPPRIAEGDRYDKCMTMLADDPEGAEAIATSWQTTGGGDGALHCQALALIAKGEPETGAAMLETLAHASEAGGLTRAVLLSQAAEARSMADQDDLALRDASEALALFPDDPDLLIGRATANDALGHASEAMEDLNQALSLDASRGDALVLRAAVRRRMDNLDEARSDIEKAIALDPDDAEALLERGILRQRLGDLSGARQDWIRAQNVDPNSEAAELAAQNLTLLDSGPTKK
jgi:Flp pilus assembly protein TadD